MPAYCAPWPGKMKAVFMMVNLCRGLHGLRGLFERHPSRPRAPAQPEFRELFLDHIVHVVFAELARDAYGVLDCVCVGSAVTHDGDSLDAQQRGSAELRIIQTALEGAECVLREDRPDLCRERPMQFLPEHCDEGLEQSFAEFQRH